MEELSGVPERELEGLACVALSRKYMPGQVIACQGQELDDAFLLASGCVKVL